MSLDVMPEENKLRHQYVNKIQDTKSPRIAQVRFKIPQREQMLRESAGEVVNKLDNLETNGPLIGTEGTCFCPAIFGMDEDAAKTLDAKARNEERLKRECNVGHIKLPIPIVQPGVYEKNYLQKLLSNEVEVFSKVVEWKAFVARPIDEGDRVKRIYDMEMFLIKNRSQLRHLIDGQLVKVVTLSNSWRYAPTVVAVRKDSNTATIGVIDAPTSTEIYIGETEDTLKRVSNPSVQPTDKPLVCKVVNHHTNLDVTLTLDVDEMKDTLREELTSDAFIEKILILDLSMRTNSKVILGAGRWVNFNEWRDNFQVLPGSYAMLDLLTDIDVDREIRYLKRRIDMVQRNINTIVQRSDDFVVPNKKNLKLSEIPSKVKSAVKNSKTILSKMSAQLNLMISFKKQNCEPAELVTDLIPVIPLEYRNRSPITTGQGQISYRNDKINKFYNDMVEYKDRLNRHASIPSYLEVRNYKKEKSLQKQLEVTNKLRSATLTNLDVIKEMQSVQMALHNSLVASSSANKDDDYKSLAVRIGSKNGKARADAQGKRVDRSGRAVITPDRTLELDEIGIPYDILKVHFRIEIINRVYNQFQNKNIGKSEIGHILDTMGDKFTNIVNNEDDYSTSDLDIAFLSSKVKAIIGSSKSAVEEAIITTMRNIIKQHRYLAIRFPSLHHLNSLGYRIRIVFSQTIHLNPLVCAGYNADFDGDQMSVFLLSLKESIVEVDEILSPIKNDMGADGRPLMTPTQDMIMGLYLLTLKRKDYETQPVKAAFHSYDAMMSAYDRGELQLEDKVQVMMNPYTQSIFAQDYKRYVINKKVTKSDLTDLKLNIDDEQPSDKLDLLSKATYAPDKLESAQVGISSQLSTYVDEDGNTVVQLQMPTAENQNVVLPTFEQLSNPTAKCKLVESTVGRFIFNSLIPQDLGFVDRSVDKYALEWDSKTDIAITGKILNKLITRIFKTYSSDVSCYVRDLFKDNGYNFVTLSGVSLSLEDIKTSSCRDEIVQETYDKVELLKATLEGKELTDATIKAWEDATQLIKKRSMDELDDLNPIKMMAVSGARGKDTQIAQMIGIRGIMMDANNNKIAVPILENFSEGLSPISYIISSYGSCKGIIDRSNKTAETGDLARHLIFGNSSVIITDGDCGDNSGTLIKYYPHTDTIRCKPTELRGKVLKQDLLLPTGDVFLESGTYIDETNLDIMTKYADYLELINQGEIQSLDVVLATGIIPLSSNIKGRTPVHDVIDKETGRVLFYKNVPMVETAENEENFKILDKQYNGEGIRVRSIQTCKSSSKGYCARCYGYLFPKHRYAKIGDSVGTFTAHALSEPGTQMTMRTFHTGGVADGDTSAGFEQLKKTILNAATVALDKDAFDLRARVLVDGELKDAREKTRELGMFLATNSKSTLVETLEGISYPDHFDLENFGVLKLELLQEMFDTFYKCVRDPMIANGLDNILSINFEITARQATSNMVIVDSGESIHSPGQTIKIKDLIRENLALLYQGKEAILAIPTVNGFKSVIPDHSEPLKSVIFQNVVERITNATMMGAVDDLTNPMSALCAGNIMPLGDNIKYYADKIGPKQSCETIYDVIEGFKYESAVNLEGEEQPIDTSFDDIITKEDVTIPDVSTQQPQQVDEEIIEQPIEEDIFEMDEQEDELPTEQPVETPDEQEDTSEYDIKTGHIKGF